MVTDLKGGQLKFLLKEDVEKIHKNSLKILEKVGMKSSSKAISNFFSKTGAEVDEKSGIIKIPEHLINEALKTVPSKVTIFGQDPRKAIVLEEGRIYTGMGGTPTPYILDHKTNEWRRPGKKDVVNATKLGDYLPEYDFLMTIAGAFDVPYKVEYIHEWEAILSNTLKPVVYSAPGRFNADKVIQMGETIKGDKLKKEPPFGVYCEFPSPLMFAIPNENVFSIAENNIPIVVGQMPQLGATAPMTFAGAASTSNAENLAALTLAQLHSPGTPFVLGSYVTPLDMRTGRCAYGAPEFAMGNIVNASLAEFYNLPTFGWGGVTDSCLPDAQAGAEVMMNALIAATSGICLIHDCGYLAGGSIGSLEMAIIANEVMSMVKRIIKGFKVDDETLAFNIIREVGPGGQYLSHRHTLQHVSKLHMADIFNRYSEVKWAKLGKKEVKMKAKEKVEEILSKHRIEKKDINRELQEIVKKAEQEIL